ncbi:MAG: transcription-repair-coupling factor [Chitinophagales bacterium]|nr:MAG: transcription-repair-coupling factor [Chitinophagales bacterium]
MNLESLLSLYRHDPRIEQLSAYLRQNIPSGIHLSGLAGSADAFVAAGLLGKTTCPHIFILTDKEEAAYFHNNLSSLLENKDVLFFPDSFKRPGKLEEIHNNNILLRTEVIHKLSGSNALNELIVTYPEAIAEKIVQQSILRQNTLAIHLGEGFDADKAIALLAGHGFERVDFVYEPGQFSVRGGIIDVYSFGYEFPYRIELFGEKVESIRAFDPSTQLSQKNLSQVTIIPNIQTQFSAEQKASFFHLLPLHTAIWVKDLGYMIEVVDQCLDQAVHLQEIIQSGSISLDEQHPFFSSEPSKAFEPSGDILQSLKNFPLIEFGSRGHLSTHSIPFHTQPQPAFNKNFNLLIRNLQEHTKKGIVNFLFSENPKQLKRFHHIFEDLQTNVQIHPIARSIHEGFIDTDLKIACYTDHQIFERYHKYHIKTGFSKSQALLMKMLRELKPGDYVTHIDHGVGIFSGLEKIEVNGQQQEAVRLIYRDNDLLYVSIGALHKLSRYIGKDGTPPKINKLGSDAWEQVKRRTQKKIKDIAEELIRLYARRKAQKGYAFKKDTYLQTELEASFIYEDTPDQIKATRDFKKDMEADYPMDRLVCGDVGFGKTEIAIRAAFKCVADSKQVAVLAPTTILTLQHYQTIKNRLKGFPCTVDYLNRFKTTAQRSETLRKLESGETDIIIGTHALLNKKVKFKDLGLLIIDEEQKFGVAAKERLRELKVNVDTLTLTATPIPRTLQFSLLGARDLSIINTPPPNRQPIQTELHVFNEDIVRDAIYYEIHRGGQVFFIHNRVKDLDEVAGMLKKLCPDVDFAIAHGQMKSHKLEEAMMRFIQHDVDVLVCTNIVESGLDIPNANTIIIHNAHHFGLSDLHQLRGRVGRSNKKAFCYLLTPPLSTLPDDARKRLKTIEEFSELGSGFNIALRDLDIRGAGNLLGAEQSGFIAEIGYETYHKILDETIRELKQTEFKELYKEELEQKQDFVRDCQVDTDTEMLIPDAYVTNTNERLHIYTELSRVNDEQGLAKIREELRDRFGPLPPPVDELLHAVRLSWLGKQLGFEKITLRSGWMRCYFPENQQSFYYQTEVFGNILRYVQQFPRQCRLKQTDKHLILIIHDIHSTEQARTKLMDILQVATTLSV